MKHYIRLDGIKIVKGFSSAFEQPVAGDICINQDGDRHFMLNNAINPSLKNDKGIPLYKYDKGKVVARTALEINADVNLIPTPEPTEIEKLKVEFNTLKDALIDKAIFKETDLTAIEKM